MLNISCCRSLNLKNLLFTLIGFVVGLIFSFLILTSSSFDLDLRNINEFRRMCASWVFCVKLPEAPADGCHGWLHILLNNPMQHSLRTSNSYADHSHLKDEVFHEGDNLMAQELAEKVRVLCWVMTSPDHHDTRAKHVKATWGKRCNILLFMSTKFGGCVIDEELPTVALPTREGRDFLWNKTKEAFKHVYYHYFDKADWFLKADDDTYVIVENLRYLVSDYNPSEPAYFGFRFKALVKQGYMSGGAGYVLSKEAVRRFVEEALPDPKKCRPTGSGAEDVEMGKCLENVNVPAMDSRDSLGRGRFFPFVPEDHIMSESPDLSYWYWKNIYYPTTHGIKCCSDTVITFHYIRPRQMYVMHYLIYHVRAFGITKVDLCADKHPNSLEKSPCFQSPSLEPNKTLSVV